MFYDELNPVYAESHGYDESRRLYAQHSAPYGELNPGYAQSTAFYNETNELLKVLP